MLALALDLFARLAAFLDRAGRALSHDGGNSPFDGSCDRVGVLPPFVAPDDARLAPHLARVKAG